MQHHILPFSRSPHPSTLLLPTLLSHPPSSWSHTSTPLPLSYTTTLPNPTTLPISQVQWGMCILNTILPGLIKRLPSFVSKRAATGTVVGSPHRQTNRQTDRQTDTHDDICITQACFSISHTHTHAHTHRQ